MYIMYIMYIMFMCSVKLVYNFLAGPTILWFGETLQN